MILIRPKEALTLETNIVETAPDGWSGATTYAEGDLVGVIDGYEVQVYRSQADGNLNNDPVTETDWWTQDGITYLEWDVATTYDLGDRVVDAAAHRVYESLAGSNLGYALTDLAWWLDIGPSNARAMFDNFNGTVTTHPFQIDVTQSFSGRVDSLALLNLSNAVSARVIMTTASDGVVYDETFSLIATAGISDWFTYFFEEVSRKTTLLIASLPAYIDPTIQVIVEGNGSSAVQVGLLSIGLTKSIGVTQHDGAQIGIIDYSRKTADDFGNYNIVERSFSKRGSFRCRIPKAAVDGVHEVLTSYRAIPAVYSASEEYGSTLIFGFFRDFSIEIDYPLESLVSIEIEGLT